MNSALQIYYILDGRRAIATDSLTWAKWFEASDNRIVDYTEITSACYVSTVFVGIDYQFGAGPPLLFETMVFGGPLDQDTWRYASWDDAQAGHKGAVRQARAALGQKVST